KVESVGCKTCLLSEGRRLMRQASSRILAIGLCGFLACNSTLAVTLQSSPEPSSLDVALESTTVQVDEVETAVSIYTGATQQTLHGTLNMSVRAVTDASGIELTGFDVVFHMLDVESQDVTASITLVTSTRLRVEADYGSMGSLTSEFDTETHALSILSSTVDSEAIVETPMYGAALEMEKTSVNGAMTQITLLPAAQLQSLMLT